MHPAEILLQIVCNEQLPACRVNVCTACPAVGLEDAVITKPKVYAALKVQMSDACLVVLLPCKDFSIARLFPDPAEVKPGLKAGQVSEDVR